MATNSASRSATSVSFDLPKEWNLATATDVTRSALRPLASLKLTVALFAMGIFIILVGTLAQVDKDMWEVIQDYFRASIAWIEFRVFFPRSFFPRFPQIPANYGFWFPGGLTIGIAMALNLVAAHLIRFKIQARGAALWLGLATIGAGLAVTWLVIDSGHSKDGLQGVPIVSWPTLWLMIKAGLALLAVISALALVFANPSRGIERVGLLATAAVFGGVSIWLFAKGEAVSPNSSSLRILWQLILAVVPGLILLAGCALVFRKRGGIVVLHLGVGLMMFSEFFVGKYAVEGRMTIREGQTVNYVRDIRTVELAVVDTSSPEHDDLVSIPKELLRPGELIRHEFLPFDIRVEEYLQNARLRDVKEGEANLANTGVGKRFIAEEVRASSGTDMDGQVDMAAVYVELRKKGSDESLGKYLLSQIVAAQDIPERAEVDGTSFELYLRFKRNYKDYRIALKDVRKDDYLGTNTPMNYSSDVRLVDTSKKIDSDFKIWMNNPLRYAGETFYQSGYNKERDGVEVTDLQVVTNTGWMMPYVGCMLVVVGMLAHFGVTLDRFLNRRQAADAKLLAAAASSETNPYADSDTGGSKDDSAGWGRLVGWGIPLLVVLLAAFWVGSKLRAPTDTKAGMRIHEFGKIPIIFQGRVKPIDTLARNSLRIISNRQTFTDEDGNKQPAIRWLLDVISGSKDAARHRVFRIENLDVLETLGLQRRQRFSYAIDEFVDNIERFEQQVEEARKLDVEQLSVYQKKLIDLDRRIRTFTLLQAAFRQLPYPPIPTEEEFRQNPNQMRERASEIMMLMQQTPQLERMLAEMQAPLAVPLGNDEDWLPYATAWNRAYLVQLRQVFGVEQSPSEQPAAAALSWNQILAAYARGDTKAFNEAVSEYQTSLAENPPKQLEKARIPFEVFFNYFAPFYHACALYVFSFVLVALSWLLIPLGLGRPFNRAAFWLIVLTFGLHTFALVARIMISGRPPVTNLYSSAVFIGWGGALFGIVLERLYRLGIGNAIAAVSGFAALFIAHFLAGDGDTFTVLQAVLDTQFWLATHVVCVTLGYAATFVAGLIGAIYIAVRAINVISHVGISPAVGKILTQMTYGTLCFAIFFSFFGTVLGGLWADDSWGRFWGWDPKENGALIIVLWNALILHARWGGMIKQRGLAMLAVAGNITTAWSWFGVNELGIGLHSYGFTDGVLLSLGVWVLFNLALIGLAFWLPAGRTGQQSAAA